MPEEKHHCFVIGPIGDEDSPQRLHADWRFQEVIIRVFENDFSDWAVERADQIPTSGMVTSQIINRLHVAELVIADLSFHNANAFYEMSIRHNVGKPIVQYDSQGPEHSLRRYSTSRDQILARSSERPQKGA